VFKLISANRLIFLLSLEFSANYRWKILDLWEYMGRKQVFLVPIGNPPFRRSSSLHARGNRSIEFILALTCFKNGWKLLVRWRNVHTIIACALWRILIVKHTIQKNHKKLYVYYMRGEILAHMRWNKEFMRIGTNSLVFSAVNKFDVLFQVSKMKMS
jgi:hypothetical protein